MQVEALVGGDEFLAQIRGEQAQSMSVAEKIHENFPIKV